MRLFYIEASPRKERSHSSRVANAFLKSYQEVNPSHEIDILDLWEDELPSFDGPTINAKYAVIHGKDPTEEEIRAWNLVVKMAERLKTADKLLFTVPMWNYHIPYRLKHYIDIITQPGVTFKGSDGLVPDKPVVVIYSSGGIYEPGTPLEKKDFQKPYFRSWLKLIGLKSVSEIVDDGTMSENRIREKNALSLAVELAKLF